MKETKEEYKQGKDSYAEALTYIIPIARSMAGFANTKGMELDGRTFVASFDVVIQHSLLKISVIDGKAHPADIDYIKSICDYGSFPDFYNESKQADLNWEKLEGYDGLVIKGLLDEVEPTVEVLKDRITRALVFMVAHSGNAAPIARLFTLIDNIVDNMLKVDGREKLSFKTGDKILAYDMINNVNPR